MYDITRSATLDNLLEWISIVRQKAGSIPIILVGSKVDLAETQRKVPKEHGVQIAEKNEFYDFMEISAKENLNVNESFRKLTELTIQNLK